jgi:DNA-binding transcriptional ArsR family regulator
LFNNEVRERILSKLAERPCSRNDLETLLRTDYNIAAMDLQGLLAPFFKTGIIKESYEAVKGKRKELYYFLIKDVYLFRIPPKKIIDAFKKGKIEKLNGTENSYYDEVKEFFEDYELTPTEINKLGVLLAIPNIYKIITLLREEVYEMDEFRIDFLEKFNYMPSNFNYLLKLLEKNDIIKTYKKGNKKILVLKSDVQYQFFFPEYLVDNIRKTWRENFIDKNIALKHLTMLRDEYLENFMKLNGNTKERANLTTGTTLDEADDDAPNRNRVNILRKMEMLLKVQL